MTSQTIQGWHPNPQLMLPSHHAPPQGWTGSWPPGGAVAFPPGYPGPPPMPGGAAHPGWSAGFWQYNPLANMQNPAQQPWAPGAGWFPPNFNPYKRIPKQASPSYWNTKLSDNGLGLEGMVRRKDPSEYQGEEPHTPWIWNPPSLLESKDRATPTKDFHVRRAGSTENGSPNTSTPSREHSRGSMDNSSVPAHNQTPDRRSALRAGYHYNYLDNSVTPTRHGSDPTDIRSSQIHGGGGGFNAGPSPSHTRVTSQADSWPNRSRSQPTPSTSEVPPYPAPTPTISHTRPSSTQQQAAAVFTQEPESFTSKADLQPTFSSNIIRTPTYYQQARRSTDELPSKYSRSPSRGSGPPGPEPLARQTSLPNASTSSSSSAIAARGGDLYTGFVEDLSSSLHAASTGAGTPSRSNARSSAGSLARSRTEPVVAGLSTIHESSSALSSTEIFLAPLRDSAGTSSADSSPDPSPRRRERERQERTERERAERVDKRTSPYTSSSEPSPLYRDHRRTSPYTSGLHAPSLSHSHLHSRSHSHSHSPSPSPHTRTAPGLGRRDTAPAIGTNSNSSSSNPLPPPPMERANLEASRPPVQEPSPPHYSRKVRKGFWNRRGDHLTPNSFVVYAPHDRAYPEDLRDYPDEREGYEDQFGALVAWRDERPELPASLPYHGRPPTQPYDSFVVYAYIP